MLDIYGIACLGTIFGILEALAYLGILEDLIEVGYQISAPSLEGFKARLDRALGNLI